MQMVWSMISNAFLVSFLFAQMSKCETRSIQIIFSKKLCVNVVEDKVCINIRCYDLVRVVELCATCMCNIFLPFSIALHYNLSHLENNWLASHRTPPTRWSSATHGYI